MPEKRRKRREEKRRERGKTDRFGADFTGHFSQCDGRRLLALQLQLVPKLACSLVDEGDEAALLLQRFQRSENEFVNALLCGFES
jgi:hypothetical protein